MRPACLGDIILAKESGIVFIPPQYAKEVVESSENVRLRDYWGKMSIADGVYTPGEVDRGWSDKMEKAFDKWKKTLMLTLFLKSYRDDIRFMIACYVAATCED